MKKLITLGLLGLCLGGCSNGGGYVVGNGLVPENSFEEDAPSVQQKKESCDCIGQKNCPCAPAAKKKSAKY
jgi:hypothetical protein